MSVLDNLVGQVQAVVKWQPASKNGTGSDYNPTANSTTITKILTLGTAVAPNLANGADCVLSKIISIGTSAVVDTDLTNFVDVLGQTVTTMVRVKCVIVRLLSAADDALLGTAAVSVLMGSNGGSTANYFVGFDKDNTTTHRIYNGAVFLQSVANAAGVPVDATHKLLRLTNEDAGLIAKVQLTVIGGSL